MASDDVNLVEGDSVSPGLDVKYERFGGLKVGPLEDPGSFASRRISRGDGVPRSRSVMRFGRVKRGDVGLVWSSGRYLDSAIGFVGGFRRRGDSS